MWHLVFFKPPVLKIAAHGTDGQNIIESFHFLLTQAFTEGKSSARLLIFTNLLPLKSPKKAESKSPRQGTKLILRTGFEP